MEYAYTYGDPQRLYLNATNRCTNRCTFCVRFRTDGLGGALLHGDSEPDFGELRRAVEARGGPACFSEIVWCGFGEPSFRLDLIQEAAPWLRSGGARIRMNTNGHACLIHGRDVIRELSRFVDDVSVSLNAPVCSKYLEVSRPNPCGISAWLPPERFWEATLDFAARAPRYFEAVQVSVVRAGLAPEEIEQCRELALSLGAVRFRVR